MMPSWILWTFAALVCWGGWAVLGRLLGNDLSPGQSQAYSTLGTLPVLALLAFAPTTAPQGNRRRGQVAALASGFLTAFGNLAYFGALNSGAKAAAVIPLTALYPMVTILLAVLFLREGINRIQMGGIALAIAAIYLFNVPGGTGPFNAALLAAVIPIALWGASGLLQKISTNHISGESSTLRFLAAFIPVAIGLHFHEPRPESPSFKTWGIVLALGLGFATGNYCILQAFARGGQASIIAPLAGLYPIVSLPVTFLLFRERLSLREAAGVALALAAVAAIAIEKRTEPGSTPISDNETHHH